jgi:4'-phosphopantetheinyl transferase
MSSSVKPIVQLPPIAVAEPLAALPGRVDLWCFYYQGVMDAALIDSYLALISQEERARHDRFCFERDRQLFLATRALVRTVLSHYAGAGVAPASWRFAEGERGKPYVESPAALPALHFNLSNTAGLVVCVVSTCHQTLGVDAECLDRPGETVSIAERYFSPRETRALLALPPARQRERFFSYWTLKESYIKAHGLGLAIPLEQFSFLLDGGPDIGIDFDSRLQDDPARWRFELLRASPQHLVAVGVDSGGAPLSLRVANFVPLRGVVPMPEVGS